MKVSLLQKLTAFIPLPLFIAGVGVFVVIVYFIYSLIHVNHLKRRNDTYISRFHVAYDEKRNIRATLESVDTTYRKNSKEASAIEKALYYLDHSLFHDYAGALGIINRIFGSKKVKEMHDDYLQKEENRLLCLEDKDAENKNSD